MRSRGTVIRLVVGVVIGIGLLIGGISQLNSDAVTCGSHTMTGNQTCTERSRHGSSTTRTVDQQRSNNLTTGWVLTGIGSLLLLCAGGALIMRAVKNNKTPTQPSYQRYGQQQPFGQQPQQFYGQQPQPYYGQQPPPPPQNPYQ